MDMRLKRAKDPRFLFRCVRASLKSKSALYGYFRTHQHALLPSAHSLDMRFLLQLLAGDKKLVPMPESVLSEEVIGKCCRSEVMRICRDSEELKSRLPDDFSRCRYEDLCRVVHAFDPSLLKPAQKRKKTKWKERLVKKRAVRREFANVLLSLPSVYHGEEDYLQEKWKNKKPNLKSYPEVVLKLS